MEVCRTSQGSSIRVSPAQMVPTPESGSRKWGTDPDHGEIGSVLSGQDGQICLILGLGFLIWVEGRWSLVAQRLPSPFPAPLRGPLPCAAGSSRLGPLLTDLGPWPPPTAPSAGTTEGTETAPLPGRLPPGPSAGRGRAGSAGTTGGTRRSALPRRLCLAALLPGGRGGEGREPAPAGRLRLQHQHALACGRNDNRGGNYGLAACVSR